MKSLLVNGVEISEEKVRQRLIELAKKSQSLTRDLLSKQIQNRSDWDTYGSELCAGSMLKEESNASEEITRVERDIRLMEDVLNDRNLSIHDFDVEAAKKIEAMSVASVEETERVAEGAKKRLAEWRTISNDQQRLRTIIDGGVEV